MLHLIWKLKYYRHCDWFSNSRKGELYFWLPYSPFSSKCGRFRYWFRFRLMLRWSIGIDFGIDLDMNQVLILVLISTQRALESICWFRTPTNQFRLSLLRRVTGEWLEFLVFTSRRGAIPIWLAFHETEWWLLDIFVERMKSVKSYGVLPESILRRGATARQGDMK